MVAQCKGNISNNHREIFIFLLGAALCGVSFCCTFPCTSLRWNNSTLPSAAAAATPAEGCKEDPPSVALSHPPLPPIFFFRWTTGWGDFSSRQLVLKPFWCKVPCSALLLTKGSSLAKGVAVKVLVPALNECHCFIY